MIEAVQKYVKIHVSPNAFSVIDAEDSPSVSAYKWFLVRGYAARTSKENEVRRTIYLHRQIMEAGGNLQIDHIDNDKLNNRRCNLRFASCSQNLKNKGPRKDNVSGVKGVSKVKRLSGFKYIAKATINKVGYYVGIYDSPDEAHAAYSDFVKKDHGEFFKTNRPSKKEIECPIIPKPERLNKSPSGFKGVYPKGKKYQGAVMHQKRLLYVGTFPTPELASAAVEAKIKELRQ